MEFPFRFGNVTFAPELPYQRCFDKHFSNHIWMMDEFTGGIEAAFKCLKSELGIRPIHHQLEHRVDAHILVAFLAYCLTVTLKHRLRMHAPGLTPRAVLEKLAGIQMLDVSFPTTDGRRLIMPRYTEPDPEQALLLHHLSLVLPQQPPPRITTSASSTPFLQLKM
jgi:hypothetical protein